MGCLAETKKRQKRHVFGDRKSASRQSKKGAACQQLTFLVGSPACAAAHGAAEEPRSSADANAGGDGHSDESAALEATPALKEELRAFAAQLLGALIAELIQLVLLLLY